MSTSVLSSLKVIARPKIEPKPPAIGKRLKLIERLEQQKEMAQCLIDNKRFEAFKEKKVKNPETGEITTQRRPTTVRPWYYDSDEHYYIEIKVGNKPIELQKGKPAIDVGDKAKLPEIIDTVIQAIEKGELDSALLKPAVLKKAGPKSQ